jgi:hypothetical protein
MTRESMGTETKNIIEKLNSTWKSKQSHPWRRERHSVAEMVYTFLKQCSLVSCHTGKHTNPNDWVPTCSGLRPGGTQAYSSSAQPESSSEVELLWHPKASLLILGSISKGIIIKLKSQFFSHRTCNNGCCGQNKKKGKLKTWRHYSYPPRAFCWMLVYTQLAPGWLELPPSHP